MSLKCDFLKAGVKRSQAKVSRKEENKKVHSKAQESLSDLNCILKRDLELCTNVTQKM